MLPSGPKHSAVRAIAEVAEELGVSGCIVRSVRRELGIAVPEMGGRGRRSGDDRGRRGPRRAQHRLRVPVSAARPGSRRAATRCLREDPGRDLHRVAEAIGCSYGTAHNAARARARPRLQRPPREPREVVRRPGRAAPGVHSAPRPTYHTILERAPFRLREAWSGCSAVALAAWESRDHAAVPLQ